jgi:hypothetical protein
VHGALGSAADTPQDRLKTNEMGFDKAEPLQTERSVFGLAEDDDAVQVLADLVVHHLPSARSYTESEATVKN